MDANDRIGVFDSGVGGISVLAECVRLMPGERFVYFGDSANAPYGTKPSALIEALTMQAVRTLCQYGLKELVVACNTATSAAAASLRRTLGMPVIGIEPAVKPASQVVDKGRMLVMATPATIRQEKLRALLSVYGKNAVPLPCPGLMEFAERLETDSPELAAYLDALFAPYRDGGIDAAVLGCTHYSFLRAAIARALPGVPLFDGKEGTARQACRVLAQSGLLRQGGTGAVEFLTSGDAETEIPHMRRLLSAALTANG